MKVFNDTSIKISWIVTKLRPPELTGTFVVKGTYELVQGGAASPIEKGELPTGDVPDPAGGLLYESDMAPFKLGADLLLVGSCHAPNAAPAAAVPVTLRFPGVNKTLMAIGTRRWERSLGMTIPSQPEVFTSLRLGWPESFGGPEVRKNPIGKGGGKTTLEDGTQVHWLPRLESAEHLIKNPSETAEPVGFGPIPREWPQRAVNMGTWSPSYMKTRWPWFPEDFDFNYFNAAPADQRIKGYLKGNESFTLVNMHPKHSLFEGRLPGVCPQLFLLDVGVTQTPDGKRQGLREVAMNLDTAWIDTDAERLILVWRGIAPVAHLKMEDIAEVHVSERRLDDPPWTPSSWAEEFRRREAAALEAEAAEAGPPEGEEPDDEPPNISLKNAEEQYDKDLAMRIAEGKLEFKEHGLDPALFDNPPAADHDAGYAAAILQTKKLMGTAPPEMEASQADLAAMGPSEEDLAVADSSPWTRERVEEQLALGRKFDEENLSNLDLSRLDFSGASLIETDLRGAGLQDTKFIGAMLAGAGLLGAQLTRADLTDVRAEGADFAGADLSGAILKTALLKDADLTGTILDDANLEGADLSSSLFCKASMKGCCLDGVHGKVADFSGADLSNAQLRKNRLEQPDFRGAVLVKADFTDALMKNATLEESNAEGIIMAGADLEGLRASKAPNMTGGDFRRIKAPKSFWEKARLDYAQFQGAVITSSSFAGASILGASFDGSDLSRTVFEEARIEKSSLVGVKVFRGSFERASVTGSDFRNSNFYETEFWDAVITDTLFDGSNLKMTKLEK